PQIHALSLHDALPILEVGSHLSAPETGDMPGGSPNKGSDVMLDVFRARGAGDFVTVGIRPVECVKRPGVQPRVPVIFINPCVQGDRKSTRLNSSHVSI